MKFTTIFLLIVLGVNAFAQKAAIESITEKDLKSHLEFIASDLMQGRDFGTPTPGLEITADYLKAQCEKMGLKPGGDGYFQNVDMIQVKPDEENTFIRLTDKNGAEKYSNKQIFTFGGTSSNDTITGDVVFCGYGWYNEQTKYNDTEGMDLKDKIVLVMTRNPEMLNDTIKNVTQTNMEMMKMNKVFMGGAKVLVLVPDPLNPDKEWFEMIKGYASRGTFLLKGAKERSYFPGRLVFGTEELANEIVKESGKTLLQLQKEINESGKPKSFEIKNCTAKIQLAKKSTPAGEKNVIGIVEGSDPVLKNECIVYSAHYDHVGIGNDNDVYNGADDNGSGTVSLLEIAEAYTKMRKAPKRSIVFAWVTAEEKGLFGSDYYTQHPVIPLDKTLVDINLDMVGRSADKEQGENIDVNNSLAGPNGLYIISGKQSSELIKISDEVCKKLNLQPSDALTKPFLQRSDYFHFYKNQIPVIGVSTGLHPDYHKTSDELDKIDYNKMKRIAEYCFLVGNEVANRKNRIIVDNPSTVAQH